MYSSHFILNKSKDRISSKGFSTLLSETKTNIVIIPNNFSGGNWFWIKYLHKINNRNNNLNFVYSETVDRGIQFGRNK